MRAAEEGHSYVQQHFPLCATMRAIIGSNAQPCNWGIQFCFASGATRFNIVHASRMDKETVFTHAMYRAYHHIAICMHN